MTDTLLAKKLILDPLRSTGITAVIVGGFLRDQVCGRPWKDIDLIVPHWAQQEAHELLFGKLMSENPTFQTVSEDDPMYVHFALHAQGEGTFYHEEWSPKVNLIIWKKSAGDPTPEDAARRVNFGLCQIAYDGETVFKTCQFDKDRQLERFTLMRTDMGLEGSMKHWMRLQEKYKGWPMYLNPERPDELF